MGHETHVGTAQIVIAGFILSAEAGAVDRYVHAAVRWIRGDEHCTHRSVEAAPDHSNDWMSRREINERVRWVELTCPASWQRGRVEHFASLDWRMSRRSR